MPGLKLAIYGIFNYYFQLETILNWALIGARAGPSSGMGLNSGNYGISIFAAKMKS